MPTHTLRHTMRGSFSSTPGANMILSVNNVSRISSSQAAAPIKRSDATRIEVWREEVQKNTPPNSSSSSSISPASASEKEEKEGKIKSIVGKVLRRKSGIEKGETGAEGSGSAENNVRTGMYDGVRPGERVLEFWEEGAAESMYFGSLGKSEGGRLDREEMRLHGGFDDDEQEKEQERKP